MKKLIIVLWLISPISGWAANCTDLESKAEQFGIHISSYISGRVVIGKGRLQFYSAPDLGCKQSVTFILAGESVDAHLEYNGFTSVLYINPKTGAEALGWVLTSRLKENGYGIGPKQ